MINNKYDKETLDLIKECGTMCDLIKIQIEGNQEGLKKFLSKNPQFIKFLKKEHFNH